MKTIRSTHATLVLAAVALTAASGCGGSKGVSRSELVAKADPICRRANLALESAKLSPQNLAQAAPAIAVAEHQAASELAKLTPPSSMEADWKVVVDSFRKISTDMQKVGEAARSVGSDVKRFSSSKAFGEAASGFSQAQSLRQQAAARDGFVDCAKF